ncbi:MAG: ABC transporter substrate-binding protein [Drouetiella hepatica Uher 2000/2452]|jgi:multiple sugar transport system substrate-binding protein|uniref:ABC transporter substrate-binding protein n=1 Tax=Drouetiella hepatica Uher 2000/2452 TaxID=904376 RepID=A0A951UL55_9CYAN|nr:ABC transporter substrate-binding protein [Drouetiella hepatica Uher 2000/2452]
MVKKLGVFRQVFFVIFLNACLLGLLACQADSGKALNPTDPNTVHLTLWHGVNPPPNRDVLQKLVDRFNQAHPQIQVESLYVGQGDQQIPKILSAVVGNAPPNMLWYAPMITGQLVELDAIRPLEDWLDRSPVKAEIDPALQEAIALEGHTWAIPFDVNNVGIFYRPSLFQAAGVTEIPKTWDDLRRVAQKLTIPEKNQHGIVLPLGKGEWTVFTWLPFMWSGGGELVAQDLQNASTQVQLDNSGAIAALQLWQDLISEGSAVLSQPERGYELDGFLSGKVAMQITGPWTLGQLQDTGIDYAVMPIPIGMKPATSIGGENLFIFKTTIAEEQASQVFAEYVLSESFQTEWALGTGYLPVNLKSRQSPAYQEFIAKQPVLNVFLQQAKYGRSRPIFPGYNRVSENLGRAIESVLLQKSTPEAALNTAQQRLDLALGR